MCVVFARPVLTSVLAPHQFHATNTVYWSLLPGGLLVAANLVSLAVGFIPTDSTDLRLKCVLVLPDELRSIAPNLVLAASPGDVGRRAPFCRPDDTTEVFVLTALLDTNELRACIAVPRAVLLEYATSTRFADAVENPSGELPKVAWEEWGPRAYTDTQSWQGGTILRGAKSMLGGPRFATLLYNPPEVRLRIVEWGPGVVGGGSDAEGGLGQQTVESDAPAGPAPPAESDTSLGSTRVLESPSLPSRVRTVPLGFDLQDGYVQVYTWDNGVVLQVRSRLVQAQRRC